MTLALTSDVAWTSVASFVICGLLVLAGIMLAGGGRGRK